MNYNIISKEEVCLNVNEPDRSQARTYTYTSTAANTGSYANTCARHNPTAHAYTACWRTSAAHGNGNNSHSSSSRVSKGLSRRGSNPGPSTRADVSYRPETAGRCATAKAKNNSENDGIEAAAGILGRNAQYSNKSAKPGRSVARNQDDKPDISPNAGGILGKIKQSFFRANLKAVLSGLRKAGKPEDQRAGTTILPEHQ